jgi:hypothetical protein
MHGCSFMFDIDRPTDAGRRRNHIASGVSPRTAVATADNETAHR